MDEREATGRDQRGEEVGYAVGRMIARPPKLPGPPLRHARRLLYAVVCFLLVSAMPFGSLGDFTVLLALLLSVAASVFACVAVFRSTDPLVSAEHLPSRRYRCGIIASVVLCLGLSAFGTQVSMAKARAVGKAAVTMANLRAINQGLNLYHEQFGMPAESLADLLDSDIIALPTFFRSIADPAPSNATGPNGGAYTSFEYSLCPGALRGDNRVIVLHEAKPWTVMWAGLHKRYGRCVLFADGSTDVLSKDAFVGAAALDAEVRQDAGFADVKP